VNLLSCQRLGFVVSQRARRNHADFLTRRKLRHVRPIVTLGAEIVIVARLTLRVHDIQTRKLLMILLEVAFGVRNRQQTRQVLVAVFALVDRRLPIVTRCARVHLRTAQIGCKLSFVNTDVALDAFDLPVGDVRFVIDDQVTNRRDIDSFRIVAVVAKRTLVLQFVLVTTLTHRVVGDEPVAQLLVIRNFFVARLALDTDIGHVLLMGELEEFRLLLRAGR
jgi:hypothetical protein